MWKINGLPFQDLCPIRVTCVKLLAGDQSLNHANLGQKGSRKLTCVIVSFLWGWLLLLNFFRAFFIANKQSVRKHPIYSNRILELCCGHIFQILRNGVLVLILSFLKPLRKGTPMKRRYTTFSFHIAKHSMSQSLTYDIHKSFTQGKCFFTDNDDNITRI